MRYNIPVHFLNSFPVLKSSFSGHSDYIHSLAFGLSNAIISGSEDGTVRFWGKNRLRIARNNLLNLVYLDIRTGGKIHSLEPSNSECSRPGRGKWIGCVASDKDWMVGKVCREKLRFTVKKLLFRFAEEALV